jgi:hypothetical protein
MTFIPFANKVLVYSDFSSSDDPPGTLYPRISNRHSRDPSFRFNDLGFHATPMDGA